MKKIIAGVCCCLSIWATAQKNIPVQKYLIYGPVRISAPVICDLENVRGEKYNANMMLKAPLAPINNGQNFRIALCDSAGIFNLTKTAAGSSLTLLKFYITPDRFVPLKISVQSPNRFEVYVDGEKGGEKTTLEESLDKSLPETVSFKAEPRRYEVMIKLLAGEGDKCSPLVQAEVIPQKNDTLTRILVTNEPSRKLYIQDFLEGKRPKSVLLSPNGRYAMIKYSTTFKDGSVAALTEVLDAVTGKVLLVDNNNSRGLNWMPLSNRLYYTEKGMKGKELRTIDPVTQQEQILVEQLPDGSFDYNVGKIFFAAIRQNWFLLILFIGIVYLLMKSYGKMQKSGLIRSPWTYYPVTTIVMGVFLWLTICGMRGGFGMTTRPITISNAGEKVYQPNETAIVLNTPFSIYRTISRSTFKRLNYYSEQQLERIYTPLHGTNQPGEFKKQNVVVLILESFSKEHSGFFNKEFNGVKYKGYTPFLDSLAQQGKTWVYSYANGVKSIDAIPSVLGGIPSLVQPFVLSRYSLNKIEGLPEILEKEGYTTAFFHGAPNGSMGFTAITNMLGFKRYYGKTEYANDKDFDGFWGIRDEEFLQYYAHSMGKLKEPFMTSVFTLSSHHPYTIPTRYENVFKGGTMPIHRTVQYADYALRRFFQTASKEPWYKNTLFVITADHSLPSSEHAEYKCPTGVFSIPIIFYRPNGELHGIDSTNLIQQIDIMPSVLGYLNYPKPYFAFGRNHFDIHEKPFVANYINGVYQFIEGDYVVHSNGEKLLAVYNLKKDQLQHHDLASKHIPTAETVLAHFKAYLQQYNNRMIDNKLRVDKE